MNCLEEYLNIFEQYPLKDKRFKKERNVAMHNWQVNKNEYPIIRSEVCGFIEENFAIINPVFIKQAICPLINECINNDEYNFLNELIQTVGIDESQKISLKAIVNIFCEYIQWEKAPIQIVNEILQHLNSDLLLEFKFNLMQEQIYYSLHELPIGILEIDALSMKNYNEVLNEFKEIAKNLKRKTAIDKVKVLYDAYFNYLNSKHGCASFEEYLNKNSINYYLFPTDLEID